MSSPLTDFANVSITSLTSALTQAGFGIPMIASTEAPTGGWGVTEHSRTYDQLSDISADGFPTTGPTYLQAAALLGQSPRPPKVVVGRRASSVPTQHFTVTPVVQNSTTYSLRVGTQTVSYTSDSTATAAEICAGLKTAIDALSISDLTTTAASTLVIAHTTAGKWTALENLNDQLLTVVMDSSDNTIGTDLDAIRGVDDSWYAVFTAFPSAAEIAALQTWCAANDKEAFVTTMDSAVANAAYVASSNSDIGQETKDATDMRVALAYHQANDSFLYAAEAGVCLPKTPGSETWHAKQLQGVPLRSLTATQRTNLKNKNVSFYTQVAGRNVFFGGKVASGEFIDTVRGRDWFKARLAERIFDALSTQDKLPYTDDGISIIAGEVHAQLQEGIESGFLSNSPRPTVIVPLAANVSPTDKANRVLNGVSFTAVLAGAIHSVTINGVISLS
jgi:Protein of unknown function (DUF3383)